MKNEIFFFALLTITLCVRISHDHNDHIVTYQLKAKRNDYAVSLLSLRHGNTTDTSINLKISKKLVRPIFT
jgi:hypothetical protein